MAEERAVYINKKKQKQRQNKHITEKTCIIHYDRNKSDTVVRPLTDISFETIKKSASLRQEFHDDICGNIPDECGTHRWCYQNFINIAPLVKKRKHSADPSECASDGCRVNSPCTAY